MKNKENNTAFWLLLIGGVLIFIIPLSVPILNLHYLQDYGTIGDTIGGISNPLTQILGSIMIDLALKAQLNSNKIIQSQIDNENINEQIRHELEQLHELFVFFENNIKNFSYSFKENNTNSILYGRRAIKRFIQDLEKMKLDLHNDETILQYDGVRELLSILQSATLFLHKISESSISEGDKLFYKSIMQHELLFNIFPYQDLDDHIMLKTEVCNICNKQHSNYPPIIFDKLEELKKQFK